MTVWIGELQWRMAHGYEFKTNPVLEPLDHIECRDALLSFPVMPRNGRIEPEALPAAASEVDSSGIMAEQDMGSDPNSAHDAPPGGNGNPELGSDPISCGVTEATWPQADIVIGNPPFLGDKKMRSELGDTYTEQLRKTYAGRVPGGADLVCYWFEKARTAIKANSLTAAGLVATNSIRGGANRKVLERVLQTAISNQNSIYDPNPPHQPTGTFASPVTSRSDGPEMDGGAGSLRDMGLGHQDLSLSPIPLRIFSAWADEPWVNEGAAVRVSLVAFGHSIQQAPVLDGHTVREIHADLTANVTSDLSLDLTKAKQIVANHNTCFVGTSKKASFDIPGNMARSWLTQPNPHGLSNAEVTKPWINGSDLVRASSDTWIVDFGVHRTESESALFEAPFDHILRIVKPEKAAVRNEAERRKWWLHARTAPDMRAALISLSRFVATSIVAKHRIWVWRPAIVLASHAVCVAARADDTTFGILHSRFHELWSLRMGTSLEDRPRYTPTTCFETFPFPAGLTPADTAHQRTETLPDGAIIPADIYEQNMPLALIKYALPAINTVTDRSADNQLNEAGVVRMSGPISKSEAYEALASAPPGAQRHACPKSASETHQPQTLRQTAIQIAQAAKKLNDMRNNWLNPPEWTHRVSEVIPLGMEKSPYPDRIEPKPGLPAADFKALQKRTLTNLYNAKPAWLAMAHEQLDRAVAAAYGWRDYSAAMPDDEILQRLLALNLARSANIPAKSEPNAP